jgi:4-hydroxythreonine-4-phosphate dehydrogenase|tara:strand:+ start:3922 stop:4899 length:978 start_codon:yes stop_codon:yes gene_type:complete
VIRIAVTPGEPSGIGPDLLIQLIQQPLDFELVAYADPNLLESRAKQLNLPLKLRTAIPDHPKSLKGGEIAIHPIFLDSKVVPGVLNPDNSKYVLNTLSQALIACQNNYCHAMVTAPVHKGVINAAGFSFTGHTEFLADKSSTKKVVMMLATEGLMVALATTHLPLSDVPKAITHNLLKETIYILNSELKQKFGIECPKILVCGLNPHAGEGGYLGMEEINVITPCLDQLRNQGFCLEGPLPADTLFTPKYLKNCDVVLAMYHDQGLPVLKYKGFGNAVNITLGLPIIRTSVDHGTALDLAGTGKGNKGSLVAAIEYARRMIMRNQ